MVSATPSVTGTHFSGNGTDDVTGTGNPSLTDCTFATGNHYGVYVDQNWAPSLSNCSFAGSAPAAMRVAPSSLVSGVTVSGYTAGEELWGGEGPAGRAWPALGGVLTYRVLGYGRVWDLAQLTIDPGVLVLF